MNPADPEAEVTNKKLDDPRPTNPSAAQLYPLLPLGSPFSRRNITPVMDPHEEEIDADFQAEGNVTGEG